MFNQFLYRTDPPLLAFLIFLGMIFFAWIGNKAGQRLSNRPTDEKGIANVLDASLLGLLSFMLAFTFGASGNRYESHRQVIVLEANSIGTALLRADLYPDQDRRAFRDDFHGYLESRIAYYAAGVNEPMRAEAKIETDQIGKRLWARAVRLSQKPNMLVPSMQMIPALNAMFDAAATREISLRSRVPDPVIYMLFVLSYTISFMAGFTRRSLDTKDWMLFTGFALLIAMIIYVTLDLDRPRQGVINAALGQDAIVELKKIF